MNRTIEQALQSREHNFNFIRLATSVFVILSHAFTLTGHEKSAFFAGISVTVFFILSGFLISASFERSKSLNQFFIARALRIYPALIVVIVITALILGPILTTDSLQSYFTNTEVLEYLTNASALRIQHSLPGVFANNYFPDFVNGCLWTMPIVIVCYALLAVVGTLVKRQLKICIGIIVLLAIFLYFHPYFLQKEKYYHNIFYFITGGLCYLARRKIILDYRLALLSAAVFVAVKFYLDGPVYLLMAALSCTYLVMFLGFVKNNFLRHFTRHGDFSYGLYIWAFPVQQILVLKFSSWNPYQNFMVALPIALILAILSWHLIEKRAIALKGVLVKKNRSAVISKTNVAEQQKQQQIQPVHDRVAS